MIYLLSFAVNGESFPMGRKPWSVRKLVEECPRLDICDFMREGVFKIHNALASAPGTATATVSFPDQLVLHFRYDGAESGLGRLRFAFLQPRQTAPGSCVVQFEIEVVATACHFGGVRRWFRCPLARDAMVCGARVQKLYFREVNETPGCRKCLDLTYSSSKNHDRTLDRFLRLPPNALAMLLEKGTWKTRLRAGRACTVLANRAARGRIIRSWAEPPHKGATIR